MLSVCLIVQFLCCHIPLEYMKPGPRKMQNVKFCAQPRNILLDETKQNNKHNNNDQSFHVLYFVLFMKNNNVMTYRALSLMIVQGCAKLTTEHTNIQEIST